MREIMSSTHDWACEAFKQQLENDLDDPSHLKQEDVDLMYEVSADLGLDMDGLILELGTPWEIERFKEKFDL